MQNNNKFTQRNRPIYDTRSSMGKLALGKSSIQVSLVLLGAASLGACDDNDTVRYDYNNREECIKDWGETECPTQSSAHGGYYGGGFIYYRSGHNYNPNKATHAKSVTRGGFGGMARGGS